MAQWPKKFIKRIRLIDANAACWLEKNPCNYQKGDEPSIMHHIVWSNTEKHTNRWANIFHSYRSQYRRNPIFKK